MLWNYRGMKNQLAMCILALWVCATMSFFTVPLSTSRSFVATRRTWSTTALSGVYRQRKRQPEFAEIAVQPQDAPFGAWRTKLKVFAALFRQLLKGLKERFLALFRPFFPKTYTVYVLKCENGKFYVGSTGRTGRRKKERLREHMSTRGGSVWTRLHRPLSVIEERTKIPAAYYLGVESAVTAEYMFKEGVNNVRGAQFSSPALLTQENIGALTGFLGHYLQASYKDVGAQLLKSLPPAPSPPAPPQAAAQARPLGLGPAPTPHPYPPSKKPTRRGGGKGGRAFAAELPVPTAAAATVEEQQQSEWGAGSACYRCGRFGHYRSSCTETFDIKGVML